MVTRESVGPGTSIPCQNPIVAKRLVAGSSANAATRAGFGMSRWLSSGPGSLSFRASTAASIAR